MKGWFLLVKALAQMGNMAEAQQELRVVGTADAERALRVPLRWTRGTAGADLQVLL